MKNAEKAPGLRNDVVSLSDNESRMDAYKWERFGMIAAIFLIVAIVVVIVQYKFQHFSFSTPSALR